MVWASADHGSLGGKGHRKHCLKRTALQHIERGVGVLSLLPAQGCFLTHSFIHSICTEYLPCIRHFARFGDSTINKIVSSLNMLKEDALPITSGP